MATSALPPYCQARCKLKGPLFDTLFSCHPEPRTDMHGSEKHIGGDDVLRTACVAGISAVALLALMVPQQTIAATTITNDSCKTPIAPNLVRNYSFECDGYNQNNLTTPIKHWSFQGANLGETSTFDPALQGHAAYLAIGTPGTFGVVSQVIDTVPGHTYTFSFAFVSDGDPGNVFEAKWGSELLMVVRGEAYRPGWAQWDDTNNTEDRSVVYSFTVTATSDKTPIRFLGQSATGSSFVGVDDVYVIPTTVGAALR
jgi:hypothetical protein